MLLAGCCVDMIRESALSLQRPAAASGRGRWGVHNAGAARAAGVAKGAQMLLMGQGTQGDSLARHAAPGSYRELPTRLHNHKVQAIWHGTALQLRLLYGSQRRYNSAQPDLLGFCMQQPQTVLFVLSSSGLTVLSTSGMEQP